MSVLKGQSAFAKFARNMHQGYGNNCSVYSVIFFPGMTDVSYLFLI